MHAAGGIVATAAGLGEIAGFAQKQAADRKSKRQSWLGSPSAAAPMRPLSAYVGTYDNAMWGTISVEKTEAGLRATLSPRTAPLIPYGKNTFLVSWEVGSSLPLMLVFSLDGDGEIVRARWEHTSFTLGHVFERRN